MLRRTLLPARAGLLAAALLAVPGCGRDVVPPPEVRIPALDPPLHDAQQGEQLVTRRGATEWHYTVVSAGDVEVVAEVIKYEDGVPSAPLRVRWHRNSFGLPEVDVIRKIEPGRIEVGGKWWDCWILHVSNRQAGQFYYWISPEVAVHGILKIARSEGGAPDEVHAIRWASDSLSGE